MTGTATMVKEVEATRDALAARYATSLRATALKLKTLRGNVSEAEGERDRLLRESAPVLRRSAAAEAADLSVQRVDQILGGRA
jgi:hypothetical protein